MKKSTTIASAIILGGVLASPLPSRPTAVAETAPTAAGRTTGPGYRHDPAATGRPGAQRKYTPLARRSRAAAGPSHRVRFTVVDRHGRAPSTEAAPEVRLIPLDGGEWLSAPLENGTGTGELPDGDYIVQAYVETPDDGGARSTSLVYFSRQPVRADGALTLDARRARPVSAVVTDRPDARVLNGTVSIDQRVGGELITDLAGLRPPNAYLTPAEPAPGLRMRTQAQLTRGGAENGSPYLYHLAGRFEGIPDSPALRSRTRDLATVRTRYTAHGAGTCAGSNRGADFGTGLTFFGYAGIGDLPAERTEYFTPGIRWSLDEGVTTTGCDWENAPPETWGWKERFATAGDHTRVHNGAPLGPSAGYFRWNPDGEPGSEPDIAVPMLSPARAHGDLALYAPHITGGTTLYDARGEVVAATSVPGAGNVLNEPRTGRHTLVVEARHRAPWTELAARQRVAWSFDAPGVPLQITALPVVRYETPLNDHNTGRAGAPQPVTLTVETWADGTTTSMPPAEVRALTLSASVDNGVTWKTVPLREDGGRWTATIPNPGGKFVSLRATLRTSNGTKLDQTVIHAYEVR